MMTTAAIVTVDSSLALKWVLTEVRSTEALGLLSQWAQDGIQPVVPSWFACEIANVLYQYVKRANLTVTDAQELHRSVMTQVVVVGDEPADAERAMELAHAATQPASYDAQYLALAERMGCELWTADDTFRDALQGIASGVSIRSISEI
jgi:predicted nucleic acid-binding protein